MGTRVLELRLESDSDSSPTHSDSDSTRDMRTRHGLWYSDRTRQTAQLKIRIKFTWPATLKHLKVKRRPVYRWLDPVTLRTVTCHHCGRCLVVELGNFRTLGLGFGLEPQTPGLGLVACWTVWTRTQVLTRKTRTRLETCRTRTRLGPDSKNVDSLQLC